MTRQYRVLEPDKAFHAIAPTKYVVVPSPCRPSIVAGNIAFQNIKFNLDVAMHDGYCLFSVSCLVFVLNYSFVNYIFFCFIFLNHFVLVAIELHVKEFVQGKYCHHTYFRSNVFRGGGKAGVSNP